MLLAHCMRCMLSNPMVKLCLLLLLPMLLAMLVQAPGDEPVWRQVLRLHLDHSDPEVAQQAAAALVE